MDERTSETLADRLAAARRKHFVGRQAEIDVFRAALTAREPSFAVLHVHGPGGVGKSALLDEYARLAADAGRAVLRVDGRDVEPSPRGVLLALGEADGLDGAAPPGRLAAQPPMVLLLDTLEALASLDAWLRRSFLPQLPAGTLVVLAGRHPLDSAWRADPGWRDLIRSLPLRNLRPEESQVYLGARGIADAEHPAVLAFTHGHPLALALVADALAQGAPGASFRPAERPDVVRVLLERFLERVPTPRHRGALEVCAHARVTTEALLGEALDPEDAPALFQWLRGLSFIEYGREGLFPHDLARDVLDADLRWRNSQAYQDLHRRVRRSVVARLQAARGREQQRAAFDLLYLHRSNPLMQRLHVAHWESLGTGYAEPAALADLPAIVELVRRHEGDESARIVGHWSRLQPAAFTVFRASADADAGEILGFAATLTLQGATPDDLAADPAAAAAAEFMRRHGQLRPGEQALHHRFAMDCDAYQSRSPTLNLLATTSTSRWLTTAGLAWTFIAFADPDLWRDTFAYLRFSRAPDADFEVGGRRYGVFVHDWRAEPPPLWLDLMGEREIDTDLTLAGIEAPPPPSATTLSRAELGAAVRGALNDFTRPDVLATNPLLASRAAVQHAAEHAAGPPTPATLQALLRQAAAPLRANPRDEKLFRALNRTYFEPAATQELAAELLGLPFSTYRYHLGRGIAHITEALWRRERAQ